jgi:hypothetical protein
VHDVRKNGIVTDDDPRDGAAARASATAWVAAALDEVARNSQGVMDIDSAVREMSTGDSPSRTDEVNAIKNELLRDAADAISYMLQIESDSISFAPWLELADGSTRPVRLSAVPDQKITNWADLCTATEHPAWRSRFGHLVVASGRVLVGSDRAKLASRTIDDYLKVPSSWGSHLDGFDCLASALGLAKEFRQRKKQGEIIAAIAEAADQALSVEQPLPGVVLRLTALLIAQPSPPPEAKALLARAATAFAADPFNLDDALAQQIQLFADGTEERSHLWTERVDCWLNAARDEVGPRRAAFLQRAVESANRSNIRDLRLRATEELQKSALGDLGLQSAHTGMILRGEAIARSVSPVTDAPNWQQALDRFALLGPMTGDASANRNAVEQQSQSFLSAIIPHTMFGGDNLPRFTASTPEELLEYRQSQQESFHLQFNRTLILEALLRLPHHHGMPNSEDLAAYFQQSPVIDEEQSAALARSLVRFWAGDYEAAAFTVAPRVEMIARNMLLYVNSPQYRIQREQKPGQYPGLGVLLQALTEYGLDPSWYRFLHCVLTNPIGWNLRNEMSHGFIDDVGPVIAAVLLQCACYLSVASRAPIKAKTSGAQSWPKRRQKNASKSGVSKLFNSR